MASAEAICIRQLLWVESDLCQLLAIEKSSFNRFDAYTRQDFRRWYHYNPDLCLLAEIDGKMAGYVISRILPGKCDLASLAVGPAYRQRNVGAALLAATIARAQAYGVDQIELEVRKTNFVGLSFWRKMGFLPFGVLPVFYGDGEDAIQMRKMIANKVAV
jgi:[ribosomal protein S18]-alanine N-acetyltransferase